MCIPDRSRLFRFSHDLQTSQRTDQTPRRKQLRMSLRLLRGRGAPLFPTLRRHATSSDRSNYPRSFIPAAHGTRRTSGITKNTRSYVLTWYALATAGLVPPPNTQGLETSTIRNTRHKSHLDVSELFGNCACLSQYNVLLSITQHPHSIAHSRCYPAGHEPSQTDIQGTLHSCPSPGVYTAVPDA